MASFSIMAEQQSEEKTKPKPLSIPAKNAETLDDLLTALTIEEYLKNTAKKLPQEEKNRQPDGSSQSGTQSRSKKFITFIDSVVFSRSDATVIVLW